MKKPFIVAISGGTCSGKSTLSSFIYDTLKADYKIKLINMDSYIKENPPKVISPFNKNEYVEHNHPDSLNLDKLYEDFDNANNNTYDCIIVEGLFALYLERIYENADLKIFVDLQSDERLVRRIKRFQQYSQSFDEITNRYLDTVRFRHNELVEPTRYRADIIINGNLEYNNGKHIILDYIKLNLRG